MFETHVSLTTVSGEGTSFDWTGQWGQIFKTDKQEIKQYKTKQNKDVILKGCLLRSYLLLTHRIKPKAAEC